MPVAEQEAVSTNASTAGRPYSGLKGQFIGGNWQDGRSTARRSDTDPYTGKEILNIGLANTADLDSAYNAAAKAQKAWAQTLPMVRATILLKAAEIMQVRKAEIVDWLVKESGSTLIKASFEWQFVHDVTRQSASYPYRSEGRIIPIDILGKESRVYRKPLGVVGVISPWNFPMYLSQRTIAPAIALGNAVVVKPAEDTPVTGGLLLAKIFEEAGLPPGVFNVINGDVKEVGDAFTLHDVPKFISFTGSTKVGKHLASLAVTGKTLKKVALELGGNAPQVVLDDADLDLAIRCAVVGRFLHQGQICMSTNRIVIDKSLYADFVSGFVERVRNLKVGDPSQPDTVIGPVINQRQLDGMLKQIENARSAGTEELLAGEPHGLVLPPHIYGRVDVDAPLAQSELFGPIVPIILADDEADALRKANDTEFGLSSSVFTRDERRGLAFAQQVEAGMTHINDHSVQDSPPNPFGGEKNSGMGRFGAEWIISELTTDHWITVQHDPPQLPF